VQAPGRMKFFSLRCGVRASQRCVGVAADVLSRSARILKTEDGEEDIHALEWPWLDTPNFTTDVYDRCVRTSMSDGTCNGEDDDCHGQIDEDWGPDTSCSLPGVCAAGNVASSCSQGAETACRTGRRVWCLDLCVLRKQDDNCDGVIECVADSDLDGVADAAGGKARLAKCAENLV
jgi:hypothetical protein